MRINQIKEQSDFLTKEKIRIIAHLKADGCICRTGKGKTNYHIYLELDDVDELKRFERDVYLTYGLKCHWVENRSGKKPSKKNWRVWFRSILAYSDLKRYGRYYSHNWDIPFQITGSCKEVKKQFIRTFFGDEGSVIVKQKELRVYSINLEGLKQMQKLLEEFSIYSIIRPRYGMKRNVYGIIIRGHNIARFVEEIGFSCKKKRDKLSKIKN